MILPHRRIARIVLRERVADVHVVRCRFAGTDARCAILMGMDVSQTRAVDAADLNAGVLEPGNFDAVELDIAAALDNNPRRDVARLPTGAGEPEIPHSNKAATG